MKDVYQIFDEGLRKLSHFNEVDPVSCFHLARDLTKVATYAGFKQGVLVAEVLEGVFMQIGPLFEQYKIPADERSNIKTTIGQYVSSLASTYKSDSSAAYELLADLRLAATQFQFKCYTTWNVMPKQTRPASGRDA